MATVIIKDRSSDNQAIVTDAGALMVTPTGGGGLSNVNIYDSAGNPLNSTGGALDVFFAGGWSSFGQNTPKQVAVSNVSTEILAANPDRLEATFTNNSSQTVYLQYSINAVWQQGYPLRPNAVWIIDTTQLYLGAVNAITQTGTVNIDVIEGVS